MRFIPNFFAMLATLGIGTRALDASILTFEPRTHWKDLGAPVVPSDALQQLLEIRMGLATKSALGKTEESTIELLSSFAGSPSPLFGSLENRGLHKIFVIVDGIGNEINTLIQDENREGLMISSFPTVSSMDSFLQSVFETGIKNSGSGSRHCVFGIDRTSIPEKDTTPLCLPQDFETESFLGLFSKKLPNQMSVGELWLDERKSTAILRISFKPFVESESPLPTIASLKFLFSEARSLATKGKDITAIILPTAMISQVPNLKLDSQDISGGKLSARSASDLYPTDLSQKAMTPLSVAPVCHGSNSSCNEATNTCSGHGFCYKKSGSENEHEAGSCYACQCYETIVKTADGTERKVKWGGPACQKRDISSPFFLIAGVSLAVVLAITTAIGMIFQVGNCELPGVISAGVGSERSQK